MKKNLIDFHKSFIDMIFIKKEITLYFTNVYIYYILTI